MQLLKGQRESQKVSLSASYVEIYQEAVTDLLSGAPVQVREGSLVGASSTVCSLN